MTEITLHLANGHPIDIHYTGEPDRPVSAFLLLAHVPADPPGIVMLNYGDSNATGNALMTFYQRSVQEHPELAMVLEQVARGIVDFADEERSRWPSDEVSGKA